ncbi:hypothetical protein RJT34_25216 [Clitoria ternatea]|uniref:Uncharacterized protein n=1 Tax=Clitoria ternatea TaxID=43366 RepID=A0AAN9FPI4_CLITE
MSSVLCVHFYVDASFMYEEPMGKVGNFECATTMTLDYDFHPIALKQVKIRNPFESWGQQNSDFLKFCVSSLHVLLLANCHHSLADNEGRLKLAFEAIA